MKKSEIIDGAVELMQDSSGAARKLVARWVNYIIDDIASRGLLKSLQREERAQLRAGSGIDMNTGRNYDLPTDMDRVFKVFVPAWGCDGILRKYNHDQFLRIMLEDGALRQGRPYAYNIFGLKTLRIHPIPAAQYAPTSPRDIDKLYIWMLKDAAHLTENDDITEWKVKHTPAIVEGAYVYATRFGNLGDFATAQARYELMIRRLFTDQETDTDMATQVVYNDY